MPVSMKAVYIINLLVASRVAPGGVQINVLLLETDRVKRLPLTAKPRRC